MEVVGRPKEHENAKVEQSHHHIGICSAFPARRKLAASFEGCFHMSVLEHGFVDEIHVFREIQIWTYEEAGEVEAAKNQQEHNVLPDERTSNPGKQ